MDTPPIGTTQPKPAILQEPQPPVRRPVTSAPRPADSAATLQKPDSLDLSDDLKLNDYSQDLKSTRDEFLGYRQAWITSGDNKDVVYGVQYGRGKDLKEYGMLRLGYLASGTFAASGDSMHLSGDFGGKAFFGVERATKRFLPGMPVPVGVYLAAGPLLNVSNYQGNSSMGIGAYGAAGLDIFGFNAEIRQELATNYRSLGFRAGFQIRF